jgi:hypothetical protein
MDIELSPQHDELIEAAYDLRDRMPGISRDERLILEMAIMMLEYLDEYAADVPFGEWPDDRLEELTKRVEAARRSSRIRWTVDEFERLICSRGFELMDGRLVPRF